MKMNNCSGLLLIALSIMVLAACGSSPAPTPAPVPVPEAVKDTDMFAGASTYTVVQGDTLAEIAARRYGGSNMYYFPVIRLASMAVVTDPDLIEIGDTLIIPNLELTLQIDAAKVLIKTEMNRIADQYVRQNKPIAAARLRNLANSL